MNVCYDLFRYVTSSTLLRLSYDSSKTDSSETRSHVDDHAVGSHAVPSGEKSTFVPSITLNLEKDNLICYWRLKRKRKGKIGLKVVAISGKTRYRLHQVLDLVVRFTFRHQKSRICCEFAELPFSLAPALRRYLRE